MRIARIIFMLILILTASGCAPGELKANTSLTQTIAVQTTPTATTDPSAQLIELLNLLEQKTFSGPGWIHLVYSTESDVSNGVVLPNGKAMPQNYITDGWFLINDQGVVTEHVSSMVDNTGAVLQREVFTNGTMTNLTFGEKMTNVQPYKLKLDLGMTQDMLTMAKNGSVLQVQDGDENGRLIIEFSTQETYEKPMIIGNSTKPVKGFRLSMIYDKQSGALIEGDTVWQMVDGTEVLFERNLILTLQMEEPLDEIKTIIENGS